ncbi:hypothetical protein MTO96_046560 [Rhipicephalus appendiculatus]
MGGACSSADGLAGTGSGEREAKVSGESRDKGTSGQSKEAPVAEPPAENKNAADRLAVPTVECGLMQSDDEDRHPPLSSSALVSTTTPLKPRSVPVDANREGAAVPKVAKVACNALSSIYGGARPVDTAAREREIEARLAQQREEERRRIRHRELLQDSCKDDWVRRSSVASDSRRLRRSSECGSDSYGDGGRQLLSRQYSNDSDQHSQSSEHGPQGGYDALVQGEPGDSAEHPPADHIRRPDFEEKVSWAPPSTDTATKSCTKGTTPEHLPRSPCSNGANVWESRPSRGWCPPSFFASSYILHKVFEKEIGVLEAKFRKKKTAFNKYQIA